MSVSNIEKDFALFVLNKSGKQHLLQPILDRCERDGITVWNHFEQGLVQQYEHTPAEAQRKVQEWYSEFLAGRETTKPNVIHVIPDPVMPVTTTVTAFEKPAAEPAIFEKETVVPRKRKRTWPWLVLLVLIAAAAGYYFLVMKPGKNAAAATLYVLAEDGLVLRSNMNCDTALNKKIINIPYNQVVELAEKIDSNRNWVKVRVPGTKGADGKPMEGYVAEYRMLGPKEVNTSLDSIYRGRAWDPLAERLSYPLKKSLYQYISNTGFDWFVDPVTDQTSFQTVVDLSRKTFGKAVINNCAITTYTKYRVAILTNRNTNYKKAMIFSLSSNYNSEKIDELDLSSLADAILYKTDANVFITDGRNKDAKKFVIDKNSSGAPVFKPYVAPTPSLFDIFDQYVPPLDSLRAQLPF